MKSRGKSSRTEKKFSKQLDIATWGLNIDDHCIVDPGEYVAFLDIQYTFDGEGALQTDLFVKPTDSRSYLQFGSTHPNHVFSAIVYSQSLRLRRIINCNQRLTNRLKELNKAFLNSNYPPKMVNKIITKVLSMERILKDPKNRSNASIITPPATPARTTRVISTYGSDSNLLKVVSKFEPNLASSPSLGQSSTTDDSAPQPKIFNFVKRTGSSLKNRLVKVKQLALNTGVVGTQPCKRKNCMTCPAISPEPVHRMNGRNIKPHSGTCTTYNIIYALHCTLCDKYYIGRTVRKLCERFGEHRRKFYQLLLNPNIGPDSAEDDEYSPGLHLTEQHQASTNADFNDIYRVFIVDTCSPKTLEVREHKYIHELKTLKPFGINTVSPFSMPMLDF